MSLIERADENEAVGDDGYRPKRILATKRIGINKAAEMPLRYIIAANPFVSR